LPTNLVLDSSSGVISGTPNSTGSTDVMFTVTDNTGPASKTLTIAINPVPTCTPVTIGSVQGTGDASPIVGQTVTVQGIVTALRTNGFFVQDSGDSNPATSDGIFVFTN